MKKNQFWSMIMLVVITVTTMVACSSESEENDISESGLKEILTKESGGWIMDIVYTRDGYDITEVTQMKEDNKNKSFASYNFMSDGTYYITDGTIKYENLKYTIEGTKIVFKNAGLHGIRDLKINIKQHRNLILPVSGGLFSKKVDALVSDSTFKYRDNKVSIVFVNYNDFIKKLAEI